MYEQFYHLSADAFRLIPDARFCFFHAGMARAHAYLEYALKVGGGFILVTGRPGTGKTTLIDAFISRLERHNTIVESIAACGLGATELLRTVAYAYGIEAEDLDKVTLRRRIRQFFMEHLRQGKRGLLIIDEAQGLSHEAIEELRLLSDLRHGVNPLLQLFLVGQDSLRDLMGTPELEPFQQRILGTCCLEPLDLQDTRGYVRHRLLRAGWKGDPEFTGEAMVAIHRQSTGVPRHINKICTRLLLMGCIEDRHTFDAADVEAIAAELHQEKLSPLVSHEAVFCAAPQPLPEREGGAFSVAEFALRVDKAVPGERPEPVRAAGQVVQQPAVRSSPPPPAARQARSEVPAVAVRRHRRSPAMPGVIRHEWHRLWRRYGNPRPALLAEVYGVLVIVALSLAAMSPWLYSRAGDPDATIADKSTASRPLETVSMLNPDPNPGRQEPAPAVAVPWPALGGDSTNFPGLDVTLPVPDFEVAERLQTEFPPFAAAAIEFTAETTVASPGQPAVALEDHLDVLAGDGDPVSSSAGIVSTAPEPEQALPPEEVAYPGDEAAEVPVQVVKLAAPPQPVVAEVSVPSPAEVRQQKLDDLLARGQQALKENRLLIPEGNSARFYFREVLALDPGNVVALDGMDAIVHRYLGFAERALERHDEEKTRRYIDRGLRVSPDDERLLALQGRLSTWLARLEAEALQVKQAAPPTPAPAPSVEPPPSQPKGFLSRLKSFFSQSRNQDQAHDGRE